MKNKKAINILVLIISILAVIATLYGIFSNGGQGERTFTSVFGEQITLYGKGIYQNDSIAVTAQGLAQDYITLIFGVALLLISLWQYNKETLKGKLLLVGILGFFLYTYMSYTFLWFYNPMFLIYVAIMSCSLYAFILTIMSVDINNLKEHFNDKMPIKLLGGFQIFIGVSIGLLWIGKIVPALINGTVPVGLEHYTTLVIQGMDLGFVVPTAILSGVLLIKRSNYGYLLSSIVIVKGVAMLTSLSAMIISQAIAGVQMSIIEIIMFPMFNLLMIACLIVLFKNTDTMKKLHVN
jgi:hypothetical protein